MGCELCWGLQLQVLSPFCGENSIIAQFQFGIVFVHRYETSNKEAFWRFLPCHFLCFLQFTQQIRTITNLFIQPFYTNFHQLSALIWVLTDSFHFHIEEKVAILLLALVFRLRNVLNAFNYIIADSIKSLENLGNGYLNPLNFITVTSCFMI